MSKKENLLKYLQKNPSWHTSQELAIEIGVSKRTIKNYINFWKAEKYPIDSGVKGYRLKYKNISNSKSAVQTAQNSSQERINWIINYLITKNSIINFYDLATELYVSETTILQDLKKVKNKVASYGMHLERNGDNFKLIGEERRKRSLLSSLIYEETSGTFMNQEVIQKNFNDIDVSFLRKIILNFFSKRNIYLNTFDLNNILLHFVIVIERLKHGHVISKVRSIEATDVKDENKIAHEIVASVEETLAIKFEAPDFQELELIVESVVINKDHKLRNQIKPETTELVSDLIKYVWDNYHINLDNESFKDRFSLHLDRLITRARQEKVQHNPIANNIKNSSPTIYECAVIIADRISQKLNITIDDNEIGYIAMHIGNAMAEQISDKEKLAAIILIPQYYDNAAILTGKIQKYFAQYINIKSEIHDPAQLRERKSEIDLIIAVDSNYIDEKISTVNISQFFLKNDIQKLTIAITTKQHQLRKEIFQENLFEFFDGEDFEKSDSITNIDECFDLISRRFAKEQITDANFKQSLYNRERMSSTAFGRVAIPHSLTMSAKKSHGFIIINPRGIKWSNNNEVYLVIALAIDPDNKKLFRDVFDELSNIVTDINNVSQLVKCNSYSEFIVKLVDLL